VFVKTLIMEDSNHQQDPLDRSRQDGTRRSALPLRERTKAYALRIIKVYRALPQSTDAQVIGKQLLRSGISVGANYREGHRARSNAEMIAKFGTCIQELDESAYWMELLAESEIVKASALSSLLDETDQLIAIFTSSVKRIAGDHQ
jgi:four helix bundle protein